MKTQLWKLVVVLAFFQLHHALRCDAQRYGKQERVLYLDGNGQSVAEEKAEMLEQIVKLDDTLWKVSIYRVGGPMLLSVCSSDPEGRTLNGSYITYDKFGSPDTVGSYSRGKRDGKWTAYSMGGLVVAGALFYKNGDLLLTMDGDLAKREADSLDIVYKNDSAKAAGNIFTKVEIESQFPGGSSAWLQFMNRNLRYPDYDVNNNIKGIVVVGFVVDRSGHIAPSSIWLDHSVEYHIDQEAVRIIAACHSWTPAIQNGRQVNSYKKQPIVFEIDGIH